MTIGSSSEAWVPGSGHLRRQRALLLRWTDRVLPGRKTREMTVPKPPLRVARGSGGWPLRGHRLLLHSLDINDSHCSVSNVCPLSTCLGHVLLCVRDLAANQTYKPPPLVELTLGSLQQVTE